MGRLYREYLDTDWHLTKFYAELLSSKLIERNIEPREFSGQHIFNHFQKSNSFHDETSKVFKNKANLDHVEPLFQIKMKDFER